MLIAINELLLLASCSSGKAVQIPVPAQPPAAEISEQYIVTDYKNKAKGATMPDWVNRWLEGGTGKVETLDAFRDRFVFISRNAGNNFTALTQWNEGFSAELDFPRLAAARIEARFISATPFPDREYGAFFNDLVRAASDAPWSGAKKEDDFWLCRKYFPSEDAISDPGIPARETWEFLVLVTIDKFLFASQLDAVLRSVKPSPPLTRDQSAAVNRIRDKLYEGF